MPLLAFCTLYSGAVYLQLLRLFRLEEYPAFTKPIDPSLYLHRFAEKLKFGAKTRAVQDTALNLVSSMKRDWMQVTGFEIPGR